MGPLMKLSLTLNHNQAFFNVKSLNSIFFQREVYPATDFQAVTKHGLTVWMAQDQELRKYLDTVLEQMKTWIEVQSFFV